jgi:hypothetical protein
MLTLSKSAGEHLVCEKGQDMFTAAKSPQLHVATNRDNSVAKRKQSSANADSLVTTKSPARPSLDRNEFERLLKEAKHVLHDETRAGVAKVVAILKSARMFVRLDEMARQDRALRDRLYEAFDVDDLSSSKLRTIAEESNRLEALGLEQLPLTREPLYELARWLKDDERAVQKAIEKRDLTQESTLRDVRVLRQPMNTSVLIHAGREVRGGKDFRQVSISQTLKTPALQFIFPQDRVPRWNELSALRAELLSVLAKYKARYGGVVLEGSLDADNDMQWYLDTYWKLKDDLDKLSQQVEKQAATAVSGREFTSASEREEALRQAREQAWKPVQKRRQEIQGQLKAKFMA